MAWSPKKFLRFIDGFPSSASTALVETDAGPAYLKAMGGREGPHTLASEVIATQLASWLGLSTFEWAIVELDEDDEIPFLDAYKNEIGQAQAGPAFVTRAELGTDWSGGKVQLQQLVNPEDISRLVVFDTWLLNCDRHSLPKPSPLQKRRINRNNVFLSAEAPPGCFRLKAMDHTHCFTCGHPWTRSLSHLDRVRDNRLFGCFPEFRDFLERTTVVHAANCLSTIERSLVQELVQTIPLEWEVPEQARIALLDFVVGRARYVAESIERRLWPQGELFASDEVVDPER